MRVCVFLYEGARGDSERVNIPEAAEGLISNSLQWRRRPFQFREEINQRQLHSYTVTQSQRDWCHLSPYDTDLLVTSALI